MKQKRTGGTPPPRLRAGAPRSESAPAVVILAAGVGSRMRSSVPKVLHRMGGRALIHAVMDVASELSPAATVAVLGAGRERVEAALSGRPVTVAVQDPPLGTGDAVRQALPALKAHVGPVLILSGDVPLLRAQTLTALIALRREAALDLAFLTFRPPDAGAFGRVVRDKSGRVRGIVEAKNATAREAKIGEVNAGVYCFASDALARAVRALERDSKSGEYLLTDAVAFLASHGGRVDAIGVADWREAWGINTRRDLAEAEAIERGRALERALDAGATILDPQTARIGPLVRIDADAVLHPFVCLEGTTIIGAGAEVLPFTRIADSRVEPEAVVGPHSDVEGAVVGRNAHVGPFARLRPGTVLHEDVRIGNFVETKKAVFGRGAKASHLAYLGDAEIGAAANIGAGVITCNYDGVKKNRTEIGEGAFIGSDSQLVAPVTVGRGAYVAAGSTITKDVPAGGLAISREPQRTLEGWADRRKKKIPR
ncbi:MAG: bifunctional UDP-N-acetylglucosamine diphosphorylase/glucosamine-1-phosphate N-acetyltransferase GlmU [Acidobacteria bacterium]|nr:bifunctional UDP-N-acetylglucosamine diphosphorylase/glucosamine-1-phosphate N-acetyltransferase GlmU [Acidobacteriota bacterium]MCA1611324.1 bifunctional UDP-N-acetylglucosamine diphosphorylase/glucosamine-1-phosphate N-acetyltransferase GlmU [Acidobacteriota bacterium]